MDAVEKAILSRLKQFVSERLALHRMVLFGSRARGDAGEYSDYDVLVVLDRRNPELRSEILGIAALMMDKYGVLVATVLRSAEEWRKSQGYPFARNIARESIAL